MTAPHIVDPARLLREALTDASPDLMRSVLQTLINALLRRRRCRPRHKGGYHRRRHPEASFGDVFPEWLVERRKRAKTAPITVVADCYLAGVSTRRVDKLVKTLGIHSLSKSQVSRMATELDDHVDQFRESAESIGSAGSHVAEEPVSPAACRTSAVIRFSTAGVIFSRAKALGHISPSSSCASGLNPSVE